MKTAEPSNYLARSPIAEVAPRCPFCGLELDGTVFASFLDGEVLALSQSKKIGSRIYTWAHSPQGCCCPGLRQTPPSLTERAKT